MDNFGSAVSRILGLDLGAHQLSIGQVSARAVVVFLAGLVIMRVANRRFLAKATPFDVLLGFILGSVLSRAISGTAAFLPTLAGSLVIVILHRLLAALVFNAHGLGQLVKGSPLVLIEDGVVCRKAAETARFTPGDIAEALRMRGVTTPEAVALATIERNGMLSIVPKSGAVQPPHQEPGE